MKASGIEREIIWMLNELIIVYVRAEDFKKSMDNLIKKEVFKKWIELMTPLLSDIQDYTVNGKIKNLDKIFDLEELLKKST